MASFVGYAIANNVGFALLSGTSARYRFYSRWGLSGGDISRVVIFYSGTFWLGLIVLGSWSLLFSPAARVDGLAPLWFTRAAGLLLLMMAVAYAAAPLYWKTAAVGGGDGDPAARAGAHRLTIRPVGARLGARRGSALRAAARHTS